MDLPYSDTLCTNLWNHAVVDLAKKKTRACCKTYPVQLTEQDIKIYNKDVFLNLPTFKEDRKLMLEGGKPIRCETCWKLEDAGKFSFRDGPAQWQNYFSKLDYKDFTESHHPNNLDIQLDNLCDLKCLYCNEEYSSQWQMEKQKFGDIKSYTAVDPDSEQFTELFFEWFHTVKDNFDRIAFLGGEPLISPRFYQYLDRILACYDNNFPDALEINIITNLNTSPVYFKRFTDTLKKYKDRIKFNINISMEAAGKQAEAIRHGVNYELFKQNFEELAKIDNIILSTITSVNVLSLSTLHEYLSFLTGLESKYNINIIIYPNLISNPSHLQVGLLPKELGVEFLNRSLRVLENTRHTNYIQFLNALSDKFNFENLKNSDQHKQLVAELDKLSIRRNINYKGIFHEYEYIWA